ncbi:MAG TPA: transcription antitermination factor NusB [Lactobacillaceae bacterium]|jgi:N utilization substance protein B
MSEAQFLGRHESRQAAFQILFAMQNHPESDLDSLYTMVLDEAKFDDYLPKLVNGVLGRQTELDAEISQYLASGWTIGRINKIALVILRLAIFELQDGSVPMKVAIDEALILAKDFADDTERKFINGILAKVVA